MLMCPYVELLICLYMSFDISNDPWVMPEHHTSVLAFMQTLAVELVT